jgi:hypothetical protein
MQAIELGIKTRKVVDHGEKMYKILGFSCYNLLDLPAQYLKNYPFCYENDRRLWIITNDKELQSNVDVMVLEIGDLIFQYEFDKLMKVIRVCGAKLHNINLEIKEMKKEWSGEQEFNI